MDSISGDENFVESMENLLNSLSPPNLQGGLPNLHEDLGLGYDQFQQQINAQQVQPSQIPNQPAPHVQQVTPQRRGRARVLHTGAASRMRKKRRKQPLNLEEMRRYQYLTPKNAANQLSASELHLRKRWKLLAEEDWPGPIARPILLPRWPTPAVQPATLPGQPSSSRQLILPAQTSMPIREPASIRQTTITQEHPSSQANIGSPSRINIGLTSQSNLLLHGASTEKLLILAVFEGKAYRFTVERQATRNDVTERINEYFSLVDGTYTLREVSPDSPESEASPVDDDEGWAICVVKYVMDDQLFIRLNVILR